MIFGLENGHGVKPAGLQLPELCGGTRERHPGIEEKSLMKRLLVLGTAVQLGGPVRRRGSSSAVLISLALCLCLAEFQGCGRMPWTEESSAAPFISAGGR